MKTTKFLSRIPGLLLISGALVFASCDNRNRTDRDTIGTEDRDNVGTTDDQTLDTYEMTESDYNTRRDRIATNLENEIDRVRTEIEGLGERINAATEDERNELQQQIDKMEARIENLEIQQERLESSNMDTWEETERDIETTLRDRDGINQNTEIEDTRIEDNRTGTEADTFTETRGETGNQNIPETQTDVRRDAETTR